MMMKISLERLLVEGPKLQHHRQRSYAIRKVTVDSVGSSGHCVKTNVDRSEGWSPEYRNAQICQIWWCSATKTLLN